MLKKDIEALLFSAGRKLSIEELCQLTKSKDEDIKSSLAELKIEYDEKNSSLMLVNEGDSWKLTVREQFLPLVRKIVTETELSKTVLETLAVVAFKYPIKQSELIKIRTNKAYEHLNELEELGYITRQKHGRTNLIKLTQKFFEYFDLQEKKLKEVFSDFSSIAKAIEEKESDIKKIKEERRAMAEQEKTKEESIKKEIDLLDEEGHEVSLEVVDEPSDEELESEMEPIRKIKEEDKQKIEQKREEKKDMPKSGGIKINDEEEKIVNQKVERILHPPKEDSEDNEGFKEQESGEETTENNSEEQGKDLLEAEMGGSEEDKK